MLTVVGKSTADRQRRSPLIAECYSNFEYKLLDASLINKYSQFVFKVVAAHVATSPKLPHTMHYRGDGEFVVSGETHDAVAEGVNGGENVRES